MSIVSIIILLVTCCFIFIAVLQLISIYTYEKSFICQFIYLFFYEPDSFYHIKQIFKHKVSPIKYEEYITALETGLDRYDRYYGVYKDLKYEIWINGCKIVSNKYSKVINFLIKYYT